MENVRFISKVDQFSNRLNKYYNNKFQWNVKRHPLLYINALCNQDISMCANLL